MFTCRHYFGILPISEISFNLQILKYVNYLGLQTRITLK